MDILFEKVYTLVTITPQGVRRKVEVQEMGLNLSGMTTETRNPSIGSCRPAEGLDEWLGDLCLRFSRWWTDEVELISGAT